VSSFLREVAEWMQVGLIAMFGGFASYVYLMVTKERPFRWKMFLANLFLAFFTGKALSGMIPADSPNFSGFVMMLGFCAYPILGVLETTVLAYIGKRAPTGE
jgi:FtsH-binding integral membrane protein